VSQQSIWKFESPVTPNDYDLARTCSQKTKSEDTKNEQAFLSPPEDKFAERRIVICPLLLLRCLVTDLVEEPQRLKIVDRSSKKLSQNRKRVQEVGHSSPRGPDRPPSKRPRTSLPNCAAEVELQATSDSNKNNADPIETSRLGLGPEGGPANTSNKTNR